MQDRWLVQLLKVIPLSSLKLSCPRLTQARYAGEPLRCPLAAQQPTSHLNESIKNATLAPSKGGDANESCFHRTTRWVGGSQIWPDARSRRRIRRGIG